MAQELKESSDEVAFVFLRRSKDVAFVFLGTPKDGDKVWWKECIRTSGISTGENADNAEGDRKSIDTDEKRSSWCVGPSARRILVLISGSRGKLPHQTVFLVLKGPWRNDCARKRLGLGLRGWGRGASTWTLSGV